MKSSIVFFGLFLIASCNSNPEGVSIKSAVIFGENDIQDINLKSLEIQKNAESVAAMINKRNIGVGNQGLEFLTDKKARKFCDGAPDGYAECTGFLVGPQLLLTAGHCYKSEDLNPLDECRNFAWVFDYKKNEKISVNNYYHCKEVIALENSDLGPDYALIKLDRKVTDRKPLKLDFEHQLKYHQEVFLIGHSLGRPLTYSGKSQVYTTTMPDQFQTMLDGFSGNSGAPVFDAKTNKVIGIHVAGEASQMTYNEVEGCFELNQCEESIQSPCVYSVELKLSALSKIKTILEVE
jgi:V8-like Glu-specific endopeptidase